MDQTIAEREEAIRAEFAALPTRDDKWEYLLKLARSHPAMDEGLKDSKFLVKGCATRLFLVPRLEGGVLFLETDTEGGADSPLIVRGLAALAQRLYSGRSPQEILTRDPAFFQSIGLNVALSATRANGFASLLRQIWLYARVMSAMAGKGLEGDAPRS